MEKYKVPVQSLIDHIKTATDVDPWAQEMAEELLTMHEAEPVNVRGHLQAVKYGDCPNCGEGLNSEVYPHWCGFCGKAVNWDADGETQVPG